MRYQKINSSNAMEAISIVMQNASQANIKIVIYDVGEGHLVCAPDSGNPREVEARYHFDDATKSRIASDAASKFVILAVYDGLVTILESCQDLFVASAILLCVLDAVINGRRTFTQGNCVCNNPWEECEEEEAPYEGNRIRNHPENDVLNGLRTFSLGRV